MLEWAVNELQATDIDEDVEATSETQVEDTLPEDRPIGRLDTDLIEALVNRGAAASVDDPGIADEIAKLVWPRLRRYDQPPIPSPFSLEDTEGHEPPLLGHARRWFAVALVRLALHMGDFNRGTAWQLLDNWRGAESWRISSEPGEGLRNRGRNRLLDSDDFGWALKEAERAQADGNQMLGKALGTLAALLFDPTNGEAVRAIYNAQTNPAWEELRWWFQPVDLQGEAAEQMKRAHGFSRSRERDIWAESDAFVDRLNEHFQGVIAGDANAFWQLVWKLQYDPSTGRGRHPFHDDLLSFPGMTALPDDARDVLSEASLDYVGREHDRADEWLGTNRYDKRGWAGYLALALIEQSGKLDEVPEEAWSHWTGAILWFHAVSVNAGDRERKTKLLAFAAQHAPERLARSLETYVRGELARGQLVSEVELVTPAWHTAIGHAWKTLLEELATALQNLEVVDRPDPSDSEQSENDESVAIVPDSIELPQTTEAQGHGIHLWELMLASLAHSDHNVAVDLATRVLSSFQESDRHRQLAIHSGRVMLRLAARDFWPLVEPLVDQDARFAHEFALSMASRFDPPDLNELEPVQLEGIYRWLAGSFPPEEDREYPGAHFVSPEEQAREFRDHVLRLLGERASEDSIEVLVRLQTEFPERLSITSNLIRARSNFFASAWVPPTPGELSDLLADSSRRFVRSPEELSELTIEILKEIGTELPAHGELLWDRIPKRFFEPDSEEVHDAWIPKPEAALSAYAANELKHRLQGRGVAVNREVLVLPRNPYGAGDRTDILVECTVREHPFEGPVAEEMRLVVEVKCAWNEDVLTDQKEQLAQRYLLEANTKFGIYLVGWYPPDQWTDQDDYRLRRIRNLTIEGLLESLRDQAVTIASDLNMRVTPIVISIPRPHPQVASAHSV